MNAQPHKIECVDECSFSLARLLEASPDEVWDALTDSQRVRQWYGAEGFTSPVCQMDVRQGGVWRHVLRSPEGVEFAFSNVFAAVFKPYVLAWRNVSTGNGGGAPVGTHMTTLERSGDQTLWRMNVRYESGADRDRALSMGYPQMVTQSLERLAALLAASH